MPILERTTDPGPALLAAALLAAVLAGCGEPSAPHAPARLRVTAGADQFAPAGTPLPDPIVVKLVDDRGVPVPGERVQWRSANGTLTALEEHTGEDGLASAQWVLGPIVGTSTAEATLAGLEPAEFTAVAEGPDALPYDELRELDFETYDGSHQVVHPDYAATPAGPFGAPFHLAITPYPFGNPTYENPSYFEGSRRDRWALPAGAPNPVLLPDAGYLSDPDLVFVPELGELWLYYRRVTEDDLVLLVRSADGIVWSAPGEVVRLPNYRLVSPSVVHRAQGDWWMFTVDAGISGCDASRTVVEVRRSTDGRHWSAPVSSNLGRPGSWAWHVDVQWIPSQGVFWALYNAKSAGGCTTPAVYMAESGDGLHWTTTSLPVLAKGAIRAFTDVVYRSTFDYDPASDALTLWFSGARYDGGRYIWSAAVERRRRSRVFTGTTLEDRIEFPPAPAPLTDWP